MSDYNVEYLERSVRIRPLNCEVEGYLRRQFGHIGHMSGPDFVVSPSAMVFIKAQLSENGYEQA